MRTSPIAVLFIKMFFLFCFRSEELYDWQLSLSGKKKIVGFTYWTTQKRACVCVCAHSLLHIHAPHMHAHTCIRARTLERSCAHEAKISYCNFVHFQTNLVSTPPFFTKWIVFGNAIGAYDMVPQRFHSLIFPSHCAPMCDCLICRPWCLPCFHKKRIVNINWQTKHSLSVWSNEKGKEKKKG